VTVVSCLVIGLAFMIAVGLLVLAGVLIGWCLPRFFERARPRRPGRPPNPH